MYKNLPSTNSTKSGAQQNFSKTTTPEVKMFIANRKMSIKLSLREVRFTEPPTVCHPLIVGFL